METLSEQVLLALRETCHYSIRMKTSIIALCITCILNAFLYSQETVPQKTEEGKNTQEKPDKKNNHSDSSKSKEASVTIDGKVINYTVTASELTLTSDKGEPRAKIFNVSYIAKTDSKISQRPVLFAFNGGPGSSAVWLHLGALGPRIVPSSPDGTVPLTPPLVLKENPYSILDVTDLVFIDPVTTGYSRVEKGAKASEFHNIDGDVESVADFIRRWISENKRWSSPKYLLGESYGGVRAAGLSSTLQGKYGMHLNGVVLLSSLLDFRTISASTGNDLSYPVYLPALTAVAHYHGVIKRDRHALVAEARKIAATEYITALHKGRNLPLAKQKEIAAKLSKFTGIDTKTILQANLRMSSSFFRATLLKDQKKVIGRFDARVAWPAVDNVHSNPAFDPSFAVAKGPFTNAMMAYLTDDLGWEDKRVYEILTGNVHPWKWNSSNSYVNVTSRIAYALQENPHLKVLVQCGHTDLATPPGGILHSVDHLNITPEQRNNISVKWYEAGHMFYLNQPDLVKMRKDLVEFITE
jgi:carboxypeptidase C (cathepsin A)